jgi:POT family proton-dependent oligopeptide transporter
LSSTSSTSPLAAAAPAFAPPGGAAANRVFLGHPAGLGWLAFSELWERFSYYGMQALLVLYLSNYLFRPEHIGQVAGIDALRAFIESATGPRSPQQLASAV